MHDLSVNGRPVHLRAASASDGLSIEKILGFYFLDRDAVSYDQFVVAEIDGKAVGCASFTLSEKGFGEIHTIAVMPSFKNKGIGKRLLNALLNHAALVRKDSGGGEADDGGRLRIRPSPGGRPGSDTIYVRTTSPGFFRHHGFEDCPPDLKKTLWDECRDCGAYRDCAQKTLSFDLKNRSKAEKRFGDFRQLP